MVRRRGAVIRIPLASMSATYTMAWLDHLWNASRLPSAVAVMLSMQNPAQLVRRLGSPRGVPVRVSMRSSQKLQRSALGLGPARERMILPSDNQGNSYGAGE